ncbi:hypothetical protein CL614_03350 [archaeon]|nr:hypothetical protein [archaeon]|tara:strand:+ start:1161 stop:2453 length:1293 start_codon:yes stop_codon:yes gene_type:complete
MSEKREEIANNRVKDSIEIFFSEGHLPIVSDEEIQVLADKNKRRYLLAEDRMYGIQADAEQSYRKHLASTDPELFEIYVNLKDNLDMSDVKRNSLWKTYGDAFEDTYFKKEYIERRTKASIDDDSDFFEMAVSEIVRKNISHEVINCISFCKKYGLDSDQIDRFVDISQYLKYRVSDVLYPNDIDVYLAECLNHTTPLTILYYFCLRQPHDNGVPNVCPNLDPFIKLDKDGVSKKRSGRRYRDHLDSAIEFSRFIGFVEPAIHHKVIVADYDIYRFDSVYHNRLRAQAELYTEAVDKYANGMIEVTSQSRFFDDLGYDLSWEEEVFESLIENDGKYMLKDMVERERMSILERKSRSLNDWNQERNNTFTARWLARCLCEGATLSDNTHNYLPSLFFRNTAIGVTYNMLPETKLPFISIFNEDCEKSREDR